MSQWIRQGIFVVNPGTQQWGQFVCGNAPGDRVFGGGYSITGAESGYVVERNGPSGNNRWAVSVRNEGPNPITVTFYAVCGAI